MAELSSEIRVLIEDWNLTVTDELPQGWMSEVVAVQTLAGDQAVLKLVSPSADPTAIANEIKALEALRSDCVVGLLRADEEKRALLLERISPATSLTSLSSTDDVTATEVASNLMKATCVEVPTTHGYRTSVDMLGDFRNVWREVTPLPLPLMRRCIDVMAELVDSETDVCLLHGDLHHNNILQASDRWVAIDPDPIVSELAHNAAAFLRNPFTIFDQVGNLGSFQQRRLSQIAETLGVDRWRLQAWAFSRCGQSLATQWSTKGIVHEPWLRCAEALAV